MGTITHANTEQAEAQAMAIAAHTLHMGTGRQHGSRFSPNLAAKRIKEGSLTHPPKESPKGTAASRVRADPPFD
jgi:hypothetical protein